MLLAGGYALCATRGYNTNIVFVNHVVMKTVCVFKMSYIMSELPEGLKCVKALSTSVK